MGFWHSLVRLEMDFAKIRNALIVYLLKISEDITARTDDVLRFLKIKK